ncbi:putative O-glycosylation ligase, exosortase A system-associated [Lacimicrobium alkaliphilum]|uniref:O-antigen polymerase n=1 Tax=Lacimicrobium alkaliphilum TaxID=1526571 RepID=A0ABQ1RK00_9ALTE|nr:putative O-glycosylation ligase, exosortase A system-associated [Lacimicrobium alkaliphilum]GGD68997.1 O-antigen polymerase [Lacimicrobium alkaliphilum]
MRDLLLVGFLFVAIYYSFKRPYIGMAAWVWIALTAPAEWAFGFSQSFRLNLTIVLVTAASWLFVTKNKSFKMTGLTFWVMMFGLWTLISTSFHLNSDSDWIWSYWNQFLKIMALFFFITLTLTKRLHIDTFIWAIVLAISAYAGMEAVKYVISGGSHRITGRAGIIADRNDLAVAINMCIPMVIYLIHVTKHTLLRQGLWVLLLLNILSIVGTFSRGGFIGLGVLAFAFWLKSNRKLVWAIAAVIMLPILYANAPEDWQERQSTVSTAAEEDGSFIGRIWAWKISTMIALDNPVTGGGFRAVSEPTLWNYYAPLTPEFGPVYSKPIPDSIRPKAAHNIYFQVLGDHGFVGLFIFLMMLLLALLNNMKNARLGKQYGVHWYHQLSNAMTLSLVAYGITGMNVSLAYFDLIYAVIGLVVVMNIMRPQIVASQTAPDKVKASSAVTKASALAGSRAG